MAQFSLQQVRENVIELPADRRYWLIRTQSGYYYDDFIAKGIVAVGYDKVSLEQIYNQASAANPLNALAGLIKLNYKEEGRPKYIAKQLMKFVSEIKKDDIVIIPNKNSGSITFGVITDDRPFSFVPEQELREKESPYEKRRNATWLKTVPRHKLDPQLYKLLYSHHTITEADQYASYIDRTINDFFIKGDVGHLVLEVTTRKSLNARELFAFGNNLLDMVDDFSKLYKYDFDTSNITVKIGVESPGKIELSGRSKAAIIVLGILVIGAGGGGFKVGVGNMKIDLTTDGIIQKVKEYQESSDEREMKAKILAEHMKDFKIENPKDLVDVLESHTERKTDSKQNADSVKTSE